MPAGSVSRSGAGPLGKRKIDGQRKPAGGRRSAERSRQPVGGVAVRIDCSKPQADGALPNNLTRTGGSREGREGVLSCGSK